MKISEEQYQAALSIVLEYENEIDRNGRLQLKRENYKKPLFEVAPKQFCFMVKEYGIKDKDNNPFNTDLLSVHDFFSLDIDYYKLLKRFGISSVRLKHFRAFISEYSFK